MAYRPINVRTTHENVTNAAATFATKMEFIWTLFDSEFSTVVGRGLAEDDKQYVLVDIGTKPWGLTVEDARYICDSIERHMDKIKERDVLERAADFVMAVRHVADQAEKMEPI